MKLRRSELKAFFLLSRLKWVKRHKSMMVRRTGVVGERVRERNNFSLPAVAIASLPVCWMCLCFSTSHVPRCAFCCRFLLFTTHNFYLLFASSGFLCLPLKQLLPSKFFSLDVEDFPIGWRNGLIKVCCLRMFNNVVDTRDAID